MDKCDHHTIDGTLLTEQEKFVLKQVRQGEVADLKEAFGEAEINRHLSARFLECLLTGEIEDKGFSVHRKGVCIFHAVVSDSLDLQDAEIPHTIVFDTCIFQEQVSFRDTRFQKLLIIDKSYFDKQVDCHRLRVNLGILCRGTIFQGAVNFAATVIGGQFAAGGAKFLNEKEDVIFNAMKVGQDAFFQGAEFHGPVDFGSCKIEGSFRIDPLEQDGSLTPINFRSKVNFAGAVIGSQFNAREAKFLHGTEKANFNHMKVGQSVFFDKATFRGPVDFGGADISGQFSVQGANFEGSEEKQKANFNSMKVWQDASLCNATFRGPVDFIGADIRRQFNAKEAKFLHEGEKANFNAMKVGQDASFDGVTFEGPVDFGGGDVSGQFNARGTRFRSLEVASFEGLKVGESAHFEYAEFAGPIALNNAHFLDLKLEGKRIPRLHLERTQIDRSLEIKKTEIGELAARNLKVKGIVILDGVIIRKKADFRDASFQSLDLFEVTWPIQNHNVCLEGLAYKAISTGPKHEDWRKLLDWINGARFNTQNYSQLEAYFSRCGHRGRADEVFISGKREAAKRLTWGKKWLTRIFWGGLAGYGRKPWQVLYVILPLVALGTFLFAPEFTAKSLESYGWLNQMKPSHPYIIQFLVSLDRFLPGVDLGLAKEWSPVCVGLFTFAYWYFLKLAGWITIPISLAAIYTRIK